MSPPPPKKAAKLSRSEINALVPLRDPKNSLLYTTREVRFMRKRVKRTNQAYVITEEDRKRLKETRWGVDVDDSDLIPVGEDGALVGDEGGEEEVEEEDEKEDEDEKSDSDETGDDSDSKEFKDPTPANPHAPTSSRSKKPVPTGYVCGACKGEKGLHWIYDCPLRLAAKASKAASAPPTASKGQKVLRAGLQNPSGKKVFLSGLSFSVKSADIQARFGPFGVIASVKTLTVPGTRKPSGQAIVSFVDEKAADKCRREGGGDWDGRRVTVEAVRRRTGGGGGVKGKRKRGSGKEETNKAKRGKE